MAVPVWVPGTLSSSDVNNWLAPNGVIKPGNTARSSTATPTTDPDLTIPLIANASYSFQCFIDYDGFTQGSSDFKWMFTLTVPGGGAFVHFTSSYLNGSGVQTDQTWQADAVTTVAGSNGLGNHRTVNINGVVVLASTATNLNLQWSQGTISATATTVYAGSYLTLQRYN